MTITARYASTCPHCRQTIAIGAQVEWTRGTPATHTRCPERPAVATTPSVTTQTRRPFRCRQCGDTRDTTITGHCDDCEE